MSRFRTRNSAVLLCAIFVLLAASIGTAWLLLGKHDESDYRAAAVHPLDSDNCSQEFDGLIPPPLTISEATTFVTGPIDQHGYIDYFAAINSWSQKGVTTEDNAAVLYARAGIGISNFTPAMQQRFSELIGHSLDEDSENQFHDLDGLWEREKDSLKVAIAGPWSSEQFPALAEWLQANEAPLEIVSEGTKRPRCYIPLIPSEQSPLILNAPLAFHQHARTVARALTARATLRRQQGNLTGAQQDLLACHRLARHMGCIPTLIAGLVVFDIDTVAIQGDRALLESDALTADLALAYQAEMSRLDPLPQMIEFLHFGERISMLNAMTSQYLKSSDRWQTTPLNASSADRVRIMYEEILRTVNDGFNAFVAAGRLPTVSQKIGGLQQRGEYLQEFKNSVPYFKLVDQMIDEGKPLDFAQLYGELEPVLKEKSPAEAGRYLGKIEFTLLLPVIESPIYVEYKGRARISLVQVGLGVAAYYADHASLPDDLTHLIPRYLDRIPQDAFSDGPLRYARTGDSCVIYSVGFNGIDEDGRAEDAQPAGDDVSIKIQKRSRSS